MKKIFFYFMIFLSPVILLGQNIQSGILNTIKNDQLLSSGGCHIIMFEEQSYLISISLTDVGTKSTSVLNRIGKVKADRNLSTYINGSEITSSTESYIKEVLTIKNETKTINTTESFIESIKENSIGFVNSMVTAGYWYTEEKSTFNYAIYRKIDL